MNIPTETLAMSAFVATVVKTVYSAALGVVLIGTPPPIEGQAVAPDFVRAGATYNIVWSIVKRTDCDGRNARVWDGADGFHLTEMYRPTTLPVSQDVRQYQVETQIPLGAPPGLLVMRIIGEYDCPGLPPVDFELGPVVMEVVQ